MKWMVIFALAAVVFAADKHYGGEQNPIVWDALEIIRGNKILTTEDEQNILRNAIAGKDYPINAVIPDSVTTDCSKYKQAGFYADTGAISQCQIFHRCDINGRLTSYLCPNETLFNQITLVCDWFFNVACSLSAAFQDYSNSRLYNATAHLLDDQLANVPAAKSGLNPLGSQWLNIPSTVNVAKAPVLQALLHGQLQ